MKGERFKLMEKLKKELGESKEYDVYNLRAAFQLSYLSKYFVFKDVGIIRREIGEAKFVKYKTIDELLFDENFLKDSSIALGNIRKPLNAIVFEFDLPSLEENAALGLEVLNILKEVDLEPVVVYSGNKSFHFWIPLLVDPYEEFPSKIIKYNGNMLIENFLLWFKGFLPLDSLNFDYGVFQSPNKFTRVGYTWNYKSGRWSYIVKKPKKLFENLSEKKECSDCFYYEYRKRLGDVLISDTITSMKLKPILLRNTEVIENLFGYNFKLEDYLLDLDKRIILDEK